MKDGEVNEKLLHFVLQPCNRPSQRADQQKETKETKKMGCKIMEGKIIHKSRVERQESRARGLQASYVHMYRYSRRGGLNSIG